MAIKPIREAPVPPSVPRTAGIGNASRNVLERFLSFGWNRLRNSISDMLRHAADSVLESVESGLLDWARPMIDDILAIPDLPDSFRTMLSGARTGESQAGALIIGGIILAAIQYLGPAAFSGMAERVKQASWNLFNPNLIDPATWMLAIKRDPGKRAQMLAELARAGWTESQVEIAEKVAERWLGAGEYMALWRRGEITEMAFDHALRGLGMSESAIERMHKLKGLIPGPGDLVRFALREAWDEEKVAKWGYDQGGMPQFDLWMKKQGYEGDWAKLYWRAHWVVPSVSQGFEMMYRGEISPDELRELLVINDVAPGWIPHLEAIARPIPGRIDRRYAFREGEIEWEDLKILYEKDGYTEDWAIILANTTAKMAISEAKGLTRSAIEKAYGKRRLSRAEAIEMLADIGIQAEIAEFYLDQKDADIADDRLEQRIEAIGKQFIGGDLSESGAREALANLQVPASEINELIADWNLSRATKVKRPSRANLDEFFKQGIIQIGQYRDQMGRLGYSESYVDWYLQSLAIEREQALEKEERAARAEQERVRKDRAKTAYQVAKASLDTRIAELNAAIASAQVALVEAENERDRRLSLALPAAEIAALERDYQPLLFDAEAAIEESRLEIARLQAMIKAEREAISLIERSLVGNRDMTLYVKLRGERLAAQTEQARLGERIAAARTAVAELQEALLVFERAEDVDAAKAQILALNTQIAEFQEKQASHLTRIEEIDEAMAEALSTLRRQELLADKAAKAAAIAEIEVAISELNAEIRRVQGERESLERELEAQITALPGKADQIAIRAEFQNRIAEIESRIATYREEIARLRLEKSELRIE